MTFIYVVDLTEYSTQAKFQPFITLRWGTVIDILIVVTIIIVDIGVLRLLSRTRVYITAKTEPARLFGTKTW